MRHDVYLPTPGDPLLASQMTPRSRWTGEQRLCWAILEGVIADLGRHEIEARDRRVTRRVPPSPRERALGYIYAHQPCWPYAFDRVCEYLDIDPDLFRAALERRAA